MALCNWLTERILYCATSLHTSCKYPSIDDALQLADRTHLHIRTYNRIESPHTISVCLISFHLSYYRYQRWGGEAYSERVWPPYPVCSRLRRGCQEGCRRHSVITSTTALSSKLNNIIKRDRIRYFYNGICDASVAERYPRVYTIQSIYVGTGNKCLICLLNICTLLLLKLNSATWFNVLCWLSNSLWRA